MFASVAIDLALDRLFTYAVPVALTGKLRVGQLLRVPFSGREVRGFVLALSAVPPELPASKKPPLPAAAAQGLLAGFDEPVKPRFKEVLGIVDETPFFSSSLLALVKWIAAYTDTPIELCLRTALPAAVIKPSAKPKELLFVSPVDQPPKDVKLTTRQRELFADIVRVEGGWLQQLCREMKTSLPSLRTLEGKGLLTIEPRATRRDPLAGRTILRDAPKNLNPLQQAALTTILSATKPVLLHGVTGSGKTEIYLQAIARELTAGRGAIVLVPEIALTPQTVYRFSARFGNQVAVLHSALSDGERYDEWHRIRTGEARVVVGPRSAVFAPVTNLGLIVVDEEHDGSYKQDEAPRYHARDLAVMRGQLEKAHVVLGSATPSLESWYNVTRGKYILSSVPNRVAGRSLPTIHLINLEEEMQQTGHMPVYSRFLLDAIGQRLRNGEQTILFLNRRGYSRVFQCAACGWIAACEHCVGSGGMDGDTPLPYTYHEHDHCLRCHVCGDWRHIPTQCPTCHARDFVYTGIGTQRAEDILQKCFPHARIIRMDADSTSRKNSHDDLLATFRNRAADILIGTQMIAKGLDFPNVTLVGVLNADMALNMPDFRAGERTYQLLAQVSGRAGRAEKPGEVFIQTFSPDAIPIRMAADNSTFADFANTELQARQAGPYPPYCHLATLVFRAQDEGLAAAWAGLYARALTTYAEKFNAQKQNAFLVSSAVPAALARTDGWFRQQVVLRAPLSADLVRAVRWIRQARPVPENVRLAFDIDALNLL